MSEQDFVAKVKYIIASKYDINPNEIYAVWLCKTLQNNKGLFSTDIEDGKYYEGITKVFSLRILKMANIMKPLTMETKTNCISIHIPILRMNALQTSLN